MYEIVYSLTGPLYWKWPSQEKCDLVTKPSFPSFSLLSHGV